MSWLGNKHFPPGSQKRWASQSEPLEGVRTAAFQSRRPGTLNSNWYQLKPGSCLPNSVFCLLCLRHESFRNAYIWLNSLMSEGSLYVQRHNHCCWYFNAGFTNCINRLNNIALKVWTLLTQLKKIKTYEFNKYNIFQTFKY